MAETKDIRRYYDQTYYREGPAAVTVSRHLRGLAARFGVRPGQRLLDVACGRGEWLMAASERGAVPVGVDLSAAAIKICQSNLPAAELRVCSAEKLPFGDGAFDAVSCLGALEHFADPSAAVKEMVRVSKEEATLLLLVPIGGYFLRRLGLYKGTRQGAAREVVLSLEGWTKLFLDAGLEIEARWKDLHVLSWKWINDAPLYVRPVRAAVALSLAPAPLKLQYQVYHLCRKRRRVFTQC